MLRNFAFLLIAAKNDQFVTIYENIPDGHKRIRGEGKN
jgi:hypothetical protein